MTITAHVSPKDLRHPPPPPRKNQIYRFDTVKKKNQKSKNKIHDAIVIIIRRYNLKMILIVKSNYHFFITAKKCNYKKKTSKILDLIPHYVCRKLKQQKN